MKRFLVFLVLILAAFSVYWFMLRTKNSKNKGPKQAPIALQKHSAEFNGSIDRMVTAYLAVKDAFVNADTAAVKSNARVFITSLDSIKLEELKKDTAMIYETAFATLGDIRSNAASLLEQSDITEMRKDFSAITDVMYPSFFKTINYEGAKLYLQNCPMAFENEVAANWISNSNEIMNPYLGKSHPKYKATMLHCGEIKDSISAE